MKKIIAVLFLIIPSITFSASFDCNKASTAVEKAICSDSELSNLDESLSALYKKTLTVHPDLKISQVEWIQQTRQCEQASSIAYCIKTAYEDRINYLNSLDAMEMFSAGEPANFQANEDQEVQANSLEEAPPVAMEQKTVQPAEKIEQVSVTEDSSAKPEKSSYSLMFVLLLLAIGGIYYIRKRKFSSTESSRLEIKDVQEKTDNLETLFNKGVFLYEKGDFDKAFDILQKAALNNDAGSQFYLGKILIKNAESKESPSYLKGIDWFKKSAAQNYASAISELELISKLDDLSAVGKSDESFGSKPSRDNSFSDNSLVNQPDWNQPIETAILSDANDELIQAVFYSQSKDMKTVWCRYLGLNFSGKLDSGFIKLKLNEDETDYEYAYLSHDAKSFSENKITDQNVSITLTEPDQLVFQTLNEFSLNLIKCNKSNQCKVVNGGALEKFVAQENGNLKQILSINVDFEWLEAFEVYCSLSHSFSLNTSTNTNDSLQDCIDKVKNILTDIVESNLDGFKETGSFKVRPGYAYDKFYLDQIEGSYDESLQGLIHHILFEEGIYQKILNDEQFAACENVVKNQPEYIYGPSGENDGDDELQSTLDEIYFECISHVAHLLDENGLDTSVFSDYLE